MEEMLGSPLFYLLLGVFFVFIVIFYHFYTKKHPGITKNKDIVIPPTTEIKESTAVENREVISEDGYFNALVHDPKRHRFGLKRITLLEGKNYGRQWIYLNYLVFEVYLDVKDGVLKPVTITETMEHTPGELYESLQTKEDMEEIFGKKDKASDKIKIWFLVAVSVVALFLMYAYASK